MKSSVCIDELLLLLRRKGIPLPYEIGSFIALEVCESVVDKPVIINRTDVWIDDEGHVLIQSTTPEASQETAAQLLTDLLCDLLIAAATGVPDILLQIVENRPDDSSLTLARLKHDLEASLIPLNRAATRRVLSRLIREAKREGERSVADLSKLNDVECLDAEFDAQFGRTSPDSEIQVQVSPSVAPCSIENNKEQSDLEFFPFDQTNSSNQRPLSTKHILMDQIRSDPSDSIGTQRDEFSGIEEKEISETGILQKDSLRRYKWPILGVGCFIVAMITLMVISTNNHDPFYEKGSSARNELRRKRQPPKVISANTNPPEKAQHFTVSQPPSELIQPRSTLRVNSTPSHSQVLLFRGYSPIRIENIPIGVAHEFVAVAKGLTPLRSIVPADAIWEQSGTKPIFRLEMTFDNSISGQELEVGPTQLPNDIGSPSSGLGVLWINTDPTSSKIYQLVGFTPNVEVRDLSAHQNIELLIYSRGYRTEQLEIKPSQWRVQNGEKLAEVDVTLQRPNLP